VIDLTRYPTWSLPEGNFRANDSRILSTSGEEWPVRSLPDCTSNARPGLQRPFHPTHRTSRRTVGLLSRATTVRQFGRRHLVATGGRGRRSISPYPELAVRGQKPPAHGELRSAGLARRDERAVAGLFAREQRRAQPWSGKSRVRGWRGTRRVRCVGSIAFAPVLSPAPDKSVSTPLLVEPDVRISASGSQPGSCLRPRKVPAHGLTCPRSKWFAHPVSIRLRRSTTSSADRPSYRWPVCSLIPRLMLRTLAFARPGADVPAPVRGTIVSTDAIPEELDGVLGASDCIPPHVATGAGQLPKCRRAFTRWPPRQRLRHLFGNPPGGSPSRVPRGGASGSCCPGC